MDGTSGPNRRPNINKTNNSEDLHKDVDSVEFEEIFLDDVPDYTKVNQPSGDQLKEIPSGFFKDIRDPIRRAENSNAPKDQIERLKSTAIKMRNYLNSALHESVSGKLYIAKNAIFLSYSGCAVYAALIRMSATFLGNTAYLKFAIPLRSTLQKLDLVDSLCSGMLHAKSIKSILTGEKKILGIKESLSCFGSIASIADTSYKLMKAAKLLQKNGIADKILGDILPVLDNAVSLVGTSIAFYDSIIGVRDSYGGWDSFINSLEITPNKNQEAALSKAYRASIGVSITSLSLTISIMKLSSSMQVGPAFNLLSSACTAIITAENALTIVGEMNNLLKAPKDSKASVFRLQKALISMQKQILFKKINEFTEAVEKEENSKESEASVINKEYEKEISVKRQSMDERARQRAKSFGIIVSRSKNAWNAGNIAIKNIR